MLGARGLCRGRSVHGMLDVRGAETGAQQDPPHPRDPPSPPGLPQQDAARADGSPTAARAHGPTGHGELQDGASLQTLTPTAHPPNPPPLHVTAQPHKLITNHQSADSISAPNQCRRSFGAAKPQAPGAGTPRSSSPRHTPRPHRIAPHIPMRRHHKSPRPRADDGSWFPRPHRMAVPPRDGCVPLGWPCPCGGSGAGMWEPYRSRLLVGRVAGQRDEIFQWVLRVEMRRVPDGRVREVGGGRLGENGGGGEMQRG